MTGDAPPKSPLGVDDVSTAEAVIVGDAGVVVVVVVVDAGVVVVAVDVSAVSTVRANATSRSSDNIAASTCVPTRQRSSSTPNAIEALTFCLTAASRVGA